MSNYIHQKVKDIEKEIDNLHTSWMLYADQEENGANVHLHYPPALFLSLVRLFETYRQTNIDIEDLDEECSVSPRDVANFAASIFEWAQLASRNGVLAANMTPCACTDITDDAISKLIGDSDGTGKNRPS